MTVPLSAGTISVSRSRLAAVTRRWWRQSTRISYYWRMSALGHKRTCAAHSPMSALPPKADQHKLDRFSSDVRFDAMMRGLPCPLQRDSRRMAAKIHAHGGDIEERTYRGGWSYYVDQGL